MSKAINIFLILSLILSLGCSDKVDFGIDDVNKHDWIKTFVISPSNFSGSHYLDKSYLVFTYKTELNIQEYYNRMDSTALAQDWLVPFQSKNYRVYVRTSFSQVADSIPIIVKVHSFDNGVIGVEIK